MKTGDSNTCNFPPNLPPNFVPESKCANMTVGGTCAATCASGFVSVSGDVHANCNAGGSISLPYVEYALCRPQKCQLPIYLGDVGVKNGNCEPGKLMDINTRYALASLLNRMISCL